MAEIYELRVKDSEEEYFKIYVCTNDISRHITENNYNVISLKKMDKSALKIYE
jgi:hypothetical protein